MFLIACLLSLVFVVSNGGAKEDRTPDPLRARQVLSQLSYSPIYWWFLDVAFPKLSRVCFVYCRFCFKRSLTSHIVNFVLGSFLKRRSVLLYVSLLKKVSSAKLVGLGGFEPPTSPLSGVRSNQLSYRPNRLRCYVAFFIAFCINYYVTLS